MICIDPSPSYFAPVKLPMLDADGALQEHRFDVLFKRLTAAEVKAFFEPGADRPAKQSDADVVRPFVLGWREVKDAKGYDVPFSQEALARLLEIPNAGTWIMTALFESWNPSTGAVSLAESVAAGHERYGLLVVHGHAGEGFANIAA